jgi:hypothetical protein
MKWLVGIGPNPFDWSEVKRREESYSDLAGWKCNCFVMPPYYRDKVRRVERAMRKVPAKKIDKWMFERSL